MTFGKVRNKSLMRVKSVIQTILVFLFAIVSSAFLISQKKKHLMFEERIFYFVSVASSGKESLLDPQRELLKNLGAANVVYKKNDCYHLIVSIYIDLESAEEIKENLKVYFADVKILKVKSKKISRKTIRNIKDSVGIEKLIRTLYGYTIELQELHMNYLSGKCTEGQFLSEMVKRKLELEKLNLNIQIGNEFSERVQNFGEVFILKLTNFLSGLDISRSRQNYICNYFVGFYVDFLEFYDSL